MSTHDTEGDYRVQGKLGEGTFSQVLRMKHRVTGRTLAMKRFKKRFKSIDEVECLREIQALRRVNPHPNLVQLEDILFDTGTGTLYLAFELMDCNLYDLISKKSFPITEAKVKTWFYQICKGLEFIHSKGIFHRDIKPENILIREATTVKLADLGSCRGIHSKGPFTEYIATRWYRSPETLLTSGRYNYKMDMWGAGCVLYETITRQPLFPGSDALDQLHRIHRVFGSPSDSQLRAILGPKMEGKFSFPQVQGSGLTLSPPYDADCRSLLLHLLEYTPDQRYSATQCLVHDYFKNVDLADLPQSILLVYQGHAAPAMLLEAASSKPAAAANATVVSQSSHVPQLPSIPAPAHVHTHAPNAGTTHPVAVAAAAVPADHHRYQGYIGQLPSHPYAHPSGPAATVAAVAAAAAAAAAASDGPTPSRDKMTEGYLNRLLLRRKKETQGAATGAAGGAGNSSYGRSNTHPPPLAASVKPPMFPNITSGIPNATSTTTTSRIPVPAPTKPGAGLQLPRIGGAGTTTNAGGMAPVPSNGVLGLGIGGTGIMGTNRAAAPFGLSGMARKGDGGGAGGHDSYLMAHHQHQQLHSHHGHPPPAGAGAGHDKWHVHGGAGAGGAGGGGGGGGAGV